MLQDAELPAYNENAEVEEVIRKGYYKAFADAVANIAKYNPDSFKKPFDTPASRIANEYVAQYLYTHFMNGTLKALNKETHNHVRVRHDNYWLTHKLGVDGLSVPTSQFQKPPKNLTLLPPSEFGSPSRSLYSPSKPTETISTTSSRKIRVKVRKGTDGKPVEDPRTVISKPGAYKRVSRKDKQAFASIAPSSTLAPSGKLLEPDDENQLTGLYTHTIDVPDDAIKHSRFIPRKSKEEREKEKAAEEKEKEERRRKRREQKRIEEENEEWPTIIPRPKVADTGVSPEKPSRAEIALGAEDKDIADALGQPPVAWRTGKEKPKQSSFKELALQLIDEDEEKRLAELARAEEEKKSKRRVTAQQKTRTNNRTREEPGEKKFYQEPAPQFAIKPLSESEQMRVVSEIAKPPDYKDVVNHPSELPAVSTGSYYSGYSDYYYSDE